jgi:hypothetical protein
VEFNPLYIGFDSTLTAGDEPPLLAVFVAIAIRSSLALIS